MIPILFEKNATSFTTNGLGRLADCIRCIVTEERNGVYECEFDYPVSGTLFDEIQEGRIIACTHDEQSDLQPFDIYGRSEPINGVVTFRAHHVSYRLNGTTVKPMTAGSCAGALTSIGTNSIGGTAFTYWTDKSVTAPFTVEVPRNARDLLNGEEGSILDVYGTGEYEFDKFTVKLHLHRGADTNVSIRYGKNLIDYNNDYDTSEIHTAVVPYWLGDVTDDGGDEGEDEEATPTEPTTTTVLVTLPEWYISSGQSSPSGREIVVPMDLSNEFEEPPTAAELRTLATSRLSSSDAWVPNRTVTVNFVQLWQTEEYKDFAPLQRLHLCDTCGIFVPMYNTSLRAKVIRVTYNVLLDRYDEMELGDKPATFASVLEKQYDSKVAGVEAGLKTLSVDIQTAQQVAIDTASADATTKANAAEQNAKNYADSSVSELRDDLETQIDAKIETWAQTSDPSTSWTDKAAHEGDLWLYTGLSPITAGNLEQEIVPQGVYQYSFHTGGALQNEDEVDLTNQNGDVLEANDWETWSPYASTSNNIFDLADGKSTIFYGSPAGTYSGVDNGDYLVDNSDGSTYRYQSGAWIKQTDYQTYTDTEVAAAKTTIESEYEQAIEDATELIRGGTGGYVVTTTNANGQPIELLITDNLDLSQAVNVWRWNQGGLAHSSNGYNGPFNDVAITADGKINASMILTGSLLANLITAGIISDVSGVNYWNLDTGQFVTKQGTIANMTIDGSGLAYSATASQQTDNFRINNGSLQARRSFGTGLTYGVDIDGYGIDFYYDTSLPTDIWDGATRRGYLLPYSEGFYISSDKGGSLSVADKVLIWSEMYTYSKVSILGNLTVTGTKSRQIETDNYSDRLLYCYETPTPLFGDIGEATIDEDGYCYVGLDDIFSETIAEQVEYQVFLQKEGEGDCWIADKQPRYFIIQGTPNLKVAWELKAKQKDYQNIRLEQSDYGLEEYDYSENLDISLDELITEQEDLLYG